MKTVSFATGVLGLALLLSSAQAAKVASDIVSPPKRQPTVELAERLAYRKPVAKVPADLVSPFNPVGFDKPDPASAPAAAAPGAPRPAAGGPATAQPAGPATAREALETLAAQIRASGTMERGGTPRLIINSKPFEIGTRFTVSYNNQDYELELVAIDRTTFTLRYRNEEVTRPIQRVR